jgi:hypothetical protein
MFALLKAAYGIFRLVRDSRGTPSWAHTLAIPSVILTMLKWLTAGFELDLPRGIHVALPAVSASDCAMILGVWLAYLGQREWGEKKLNPPATPPTTTTGGT